MIHPEAYALLCSLLRMTGYLIESDQAQDGARARVIEARTCTPVGYVYAEPVRYEATRGPVPHVDAVIDLWLDALVSAEHLEGAQAPLPAYPGGAS